MRGDRQLAPQCAGSQQLHVHTGACEPSLVEVLRLDGHAVLEAVQLTQVDHGVDLLERVLESAQLGQPLGEWHLAALEPEPEALAARQLALLTTPRGLAAARPCSTTDPSLPGAGALGRPQLVQLHYLPLECFLAERTRGILYRPRLGGFQGSPSTETRNPTFFSMPRTTGVSGSSRVCCSLRKPSDWMVAFMFSEYPMALFFHVARSDTAREPALTTASPQAWPAQSPARPAARARLAVSASSPPRMQEEAGSARPWLSERRPQPASVRPPRRRCSSTRSPLPAGLPRQPTGRRLRASCRQPRRSPCPLALPPPGLYEATAEPPSSPGLC